MREGNRRSLGTVLMAVGLLLILSVGGYFAWEEVQAAQVRNDLDQSALAAAQRATRVAETLAKAQQVPDDPSQKVGAAPVAATVTATMAPTQTPTVRPTSTALPTETATRRSTVAPSATVELPTPTPPPPTASPVPPTEPPPTPAPVLPVRLVIPDLKIDTKVTEMGWTITQTKNGPVSEWDIPKNGAGHHLNSASIGQPENLVISGHNNIYGRVFMPISQAWDNDKRVKVDNFTDKSPVLDGREVFLYDAAGNKHSYVITDFYRLKDTGVSQAQRVVNGRFIQPTGDERVTIVTCWPPTNNTHRLIVIARPEQ